MEECGTSQDKSGNVRKSLEQVRNYVEQVRKSQDKSGNVCETSGKLWEMTGNPKNYTIPKATHP